MNLNAVGLDPESSIQKGLSYGNGSHPDGRASALSGSGD
jgi:hypothetical protein